MKKVLVLSLILFIVTLFSGCNPRKEELLLYVEIVGEGYLIPDPDKLTYRKGDKVKVTAIPHDDYIFKEFIINGVSNTNNPVTIEIIENTKLKAVFYKKSDLYSLEINVQGGGRVEVSPEKDYFEKGEKVTIKAIADSGWYFDHWEGDVSGVSSSLVVTMDCDKEIVAVFKSDKAFYLLTTTANGKGSVVRYPAKLYFSPDEEVTITAIPDYGWYLDHWEGDVTGNDSVLTLMLQKDTNVIGVFKEKEFKINVNIIGDGIVTLSPLKDTYRTGDVVTITATPNSGWIFDSWGGSLSGKDLSKTITVTDNLNITAKFRNIVYISLVKSSTDQPVIASYPSELQVGQDLIVNLSWVYSSGNKIYYLKVDDVTVTPSYSYTIEPVSFSGNTASQNIVIHNVYNDIYVSIVIGEYFKVNTVAYRPDRTVFPPGFLIISQSPAPSHTVYGTSGLYRKGERVTFSAPAYTQAHRFFHWRWEDEQTFISNNPVTYTINKSGTLGAYYEQI